MSFFNNKDEVTICSYHKELPTQLIWTFAFPYKEFWCPSCGATWGMMGAGDNTKWTWAIHDRYIEDRKRSKAFLGAKGAFSCSQLKYKGEWIKPKDMPESLRKRYKKIIDSWEYIK